MYVWKYLVLQTTQLCFHLQKKQFSVINVMINMWNIIEMWKCISVVQF